MRQRISCWGVVIALLAANTGRTRTVAPPYEIGTWAGFRTAAVSYTCDDCWPNQLQVAVPMFDEFGFKLTLFIITGETPDWAALRQAAAHGHEIGSHTVTHAWLNRVSLKKQAAELKASQAEINARIPGHACVTLAYPYGAASDAELCRRFYLAARGCQDRVEGRTPADFLNIAALICGAKGRVQTAADFQGRCAAAAGAGGWCVFLIHAIDSSTGYSSLPSATLRESLQYLDRQRGTFWVETFGNVVRYIRQRDDASVIVSARQEQRETLLVTDTLDQAVGRVPLTLRRPLPAGWPSARVAQGGHPLAAEIVTLASRPYVMFDVVPNGGAVVLTRAPMAPTGLTAARGPAGITLDWRAGNGSDPAGYHVYRSTPAGRGYGRLNASLVRRPSYSDVHVTPGRAYRYVITAVDAQANESGYSNVVSIRPS